MTKEETLAAEAIAWLESPEGAAAMKEALANAERAIKEMRQASKIPWRVMNRPMTI